MTRPIDGFELVSMRTQNFGSRRYGPEERLDAVDVRLWRSMPRHKQDVLEQLGFVRLLPIVPAGK